MKKIFTTAFAMALCASLAYGQRTIDISTELISPAAGSTITDETPFDIQVKVTNTGPDEMVAGDSLIFVLYSGSINNTLHPITLLSKTDVIANGSSKTYTVTGVTVNVNVETSNAQICASVFLFNAALPDSVKDNTIGGNNASCNMYNVVFQTGLNGPDAFASSLYPNPVTGENATIRFEAKEAGSASVRIYDLSGKLVSEQTIASLGGSQEVDVEAGDLKNGVYIYEIQMGETVSRNKFMVNR